SRIIDSCTVTVLTSNRYNLMREFPVIVDLGSPDRVVLVLDASHDARPFRDEMNRLVDDLLSGLPRTAQPAIYFLGNGRPYPADVFAQSRAQWYEENQWGVRLLRPLYQ